MKSHRAMLIARCDMMRAMLNGDFREAHSNVVSISFFNSKIINKYSVDIGIDSMGGRHLDVLQIIFPGVTEYTFHKLLCYLYTDEIPQISTEKCLNLLELANRLCLPRLLNLVECRVIEDLTKISQTETSEAVQHCLSLLEPVKVSKMMDVFLFTHRHTFQAWHFCSLLPNSYTMRISWPNGACHICAWIITSFAKHHRNAWKHCIQKIRNICANIDGLRYGIWKISITISVAWTKWIAKVIKDGASAPMKIPTVVYASQVVSLHVLYK